MGLIITIINWWNCFFFFVMFFVYGGYFEKIELNICTEFCLSFGGRPYLDDMLTR